MKKCKHCEYYEPGASIRDIAGGHCLYNPPIVFPVPQANGSFAAMPIVPPVAADSRCSHHVNKLVLSS